MFGPLSDVLLLAAVLSGGALDGGDGEETSFRRGDTNGDGRIDVSDAIHTLRYLFSGAPTRCVDASDVDDSGHVNISDPVYLLNVLFAASRTPPPPFDECGPDPRDDSLDCESFPTCPPLITVEIVGRAVLPHGVPASGATITDPFGVQAVAGDGGDFTFRLRAPSGGWQGHLSIRLDEYFGAIALSHLTGGDVLDAGTVVLVLPEGLRRVVATGAVVFPGGEPAEDATIRLGDTRLRPAPDGSFSAELVLPLGETIQVLVQSEHGGRFLTARTAFLVDATVEVDLGTLVLSDGGELPFGGPCCRPLSAGSALVSAVLGDFDADGILDLAGADATNGRVLVLPGKGDGSFGDEVAYPAGDGRPWSLVPPPLLLGSSSRTSELIRPAAVTPWWRSGRREDTACAEPAVGSGPTCSAARRFAPAGARRLHPVGVSPR